MMTGLLILGTFRSSKPGSAPTYCEILISYSQGRYINGGLAGAGEQGFEL